MRARLRVCVFLLCPRKNQFIVIVIVIVVVIVVVIVIVVVAVHCE